MARGVRDTEYRRRLFVAQNRKCLFCGKFCKFTSKYSEYSLFTLEHVVPKRFGGQRYRNVVGACFRCNLKRGREIELSPQSRHKEIFENRYKENQKLQQRFVHVWKRGC